MTNDWVNPFTWKRLFQLLFEPPAKLALIPTMTNWPEHPASRKHQFGSQHGLQQLPKAASQLNHEPQGRVTPQIGGLLYHRLITMWLGIEASMQLLQTLHHRFSWQILQPLFDGGHQVLEPLSNLVVGFQQSFSRTHVPPSEELKLHLSFGANGLHPLLSGAREALYHKQRYGSIFIVFLFQSPVNILKLVFFGQGAIHCQFGY